MFYVLNYTDLIIKLTSDVYWIAWLSCYHVCQPHRILLWCFILFSVYKTVIKPALRIRLFFSSWNEPSWIILLSCVGRVCFAFLQYFSLCVTKRGWIRAGSPLRHKPICFVVMRDACLCSILLFVNEVKKIISEYPDSICAVLI